MDFAKYLPVTVAQIELHENVTAKHVPFCLEDYSCNTFGT
jgi:hypothetical protein